MPVNVFVARISHPYLRNKTRKDEIGPSCLFIFAGSKINLKEAQRAPGAVVVAVTGVTGVTEAKNLGHGFL